MEKTWTNVSTSSEVKPDQDYATPTKVMQTAVTTSNTRQPLDYNWTSTNESTIFFILLHISEIENISPTDHRELNIFGNGVLKFNRSYVPSELASGWASYADLGKTEYNLSLKATSNSTLPPLLNALEVYVVTFAIGIPTNSEDGMFYYSCPIMYVLNLLNYWYFN